MTPEDNRPALIMPDPTRLGPAMKLLTDGQRRFVIALLEFGDNNFTKACLVAYPTQSDGTARKYGSDLAHNPKVIAAIHEEAQKRMDASAIMLASRAAEIANNPQHRSQMKAIEFLANRTGFIPEHKVTVEHRADPRELEQRALALCKELGLDPVKLLGNRAVSKALEPPKPLAVDAEFTEVGSADPTGREGLEDLL